MPRSENPAKRRYDYKQIELFGQCSLPVDDMAIILNASVERIQKLMERETSTFYRSYRRGQALTRLGILQKQIAVATGQATGNPGLLTHLGTLLLGQDKSKKPENKQDAAEKLIQNVSDAQKAEMFTALTGTQTNQDDIIDDSDTDEYTP